MSAGAIIHTDKTVNSALQGFFRPTAVSDIMVYRDTRGPGFIHHPAWIAQRGNKKGDVLLQGDLHPLMYTLQVPF